MRILPSLFSLLPTGIRQIQPTGQFSIDIYRPRAQAEGSRGAAELGYSGTRGKGEFSVRYLLCGVPLRLSSLRQAGTHAPCPGSSAGTTPVSSLPAGEQEEIAAVRRSRGISGVAPHFVSHPQWRRLRGTLPHEATHLHSISSRHSGRNRLPA